MTKFAVDTSVLVAASQSGDARGPVALAVIEARLDGGDSMVIAGHSLVETYSVLTRLPPHLRLTPQAAGAAVRSFAVAAETVALPGNRYLELLGRVSSEGIAGGRVYDAVIATAVADAGAEVLFTFNARHFEGLVPGLVVEEPR